MIAVGWSRLAPTAVVCFAMSHARLFCAKVEGPYFGGAVWAIGQLLLALRCPTEACSAIRLSRILLRWESTGHGADPTVLQVPDDFIVTIGYPLTLVLRCPTHARLSCAKVEVERKAFRDIHEMSFSVPCCGEAVCGRPDYRITCKMTHPLHPLHRIVGHISKAIFSTTGRTLTPIERCVYGPKQPFSWCVPR